MGLPSHIKENLLLGFLVFLLVMGFGTFMGVLFCDGFQKYVSSRLDIWEKSEVLQFIGIAMGGILIAVQALMSYKRATALESTAKAQADAANAQAHAANAQAKATKEQAKANLHTEQGLRQERLKNAIEHLGHKSDSVRLGGAYELVHLAEDTKSMRQTVLDIFCAHIRRMTGEDDYREKHKSKPSEEIQSILTLLFVQEHDVFEDLPIDLRGSWLTGAELRNARLKAAILREVNLQKADLIGAHLETAVLARAQLQGAILQGAHMQESKLHGASLIKAILRHVQLQGTELVGAYLQGTNLSGVHLQASNLSDACLQGTDLNNAHLEGTCLAGSKLQGANLQNASIQGAALQGANVQGVRCVTGFPRSYEERIRQSIGKDTDLSKAKYAGGLTIEDVQRLTSGLSNKKKKELRGILTPHVGIPLRQGHPPRSGANRGSYSEDEAQEWIDEFEEATSEIPEDDS